MLVTELLKLFFNQMLPTVLSKYYNLNFYDLNFRNISNLFSKYFDLILIIF